MPEISQLHYTGPEWFQLALDNTLENGRPVLILSLWENWSVQTT
jgi:hypothetical protein